MAFDKKHYKEIKEFVAHQLQYRPFLYTGNCPIKWAATKLHLVTFCEHHQDFEGAAAVRDAIFEFVNKFLPEDQKLSKEADLLKLPEYEETVIYGHVSYDDPKNPYWNCPDNIY